ncbi:MAG: class I SAM-dependent methyltransferase [Pseudomonadota bacterium]
MPSSRERWDNRYAARPDVWSRGPNARLVAEVQNLSPGRALDAGCGEGRNALWLASLGWQVTAVDYSRVAIDKARARDRDLKIDWQVADLVALAPASRVYDLIVVLYLHTSEAERAHWLPKLIDATAPGGTFFYLGHDPRNIEEGHGGPQDPALLPDAAAISAALTGFEVDVATVVERTVNEDPGHGSPGSGIALDTLVRARRQLTATD